MACCSPLRRAELLDQFLAFMNRLLVQLIRQGVSVVLPLVSRCFKSELLFSEPRCEGYLLAQLLCELLRQFIALLLKLPLFFLQPSYLVIRNSRGGANSSALIAFSSAFGCVSRGAKSEASGCQAGSMLARGDHR